MNIADILATPLVIKLKVNFSDDDITQPDCLKELANIDNNQKVISVIYVQYAFTTQFTKGCEGCFSSSIG